jgi:hypothetical protein
MRLKDVDSDDLGYLGIAWMRSSVEGKRDISRL